MKLYFVGIGMGNPALLTIEGRRIMESSDCLIGAKRMLEPFAHFKGLRLEEYRADCIIPFLQSHPQLNQVAVLFSGDVGFYSGAAGLREALSNAGYEVEYCSGISSLAYFCNLLQIPWQDVTVCSMHGREHELEQVVANHSKTFVLTGSNCTAAQVCQRLAAAGIDGNIIIGERLSYPEQRMLYGTAQTLQQKEIDPLAVLLIQRQTAAVTEQLFTPGLPDQVFLRGTVPMTKREVRAAILSKLQLQQGDIVYDIGAGTGSVAIEMALHNRQGKIFAIEKNPVALELLQSNKEKFAVDNLTIVAGTAPDALAALPVPQAAFIGGSGGKLVEIVQYLLKRNPRIRLVLTAIALETIGQAWPLWQQLIGTEVVQLQVSRAEAVGTLHLWKGQNPIYLFSGTGGGLDEV